MLIALSAPAQPADRAEQLAETRRAFEPEVTPLAGERRVLNASALAALTGPDTPQREALERWLARHRAVVLRDDKPGLTLRFHADGIDPMSPTDRLWEGLPRKAHSLQDLIDHALTRAREQQRPIARLIIIGHAGLPGCAALGSTPDDCVFRGRLTAYHRRQLARLRPYLAHDAEIELRQCVTGQGEEGERLLTTLHRITGATASSYLADFHFGDSAAHPRVVVSEDGLRFVLPK